MRLLFLSLLTLNFSCVREFKNIDEYYKFINAPKHHLVHEKEINGIKLNVKYLPPELLALQEYNTLAQQTRVEKLIEDYSKGMQFMFRVSPAGQLKDEMGIRYFGLNSDQEIVDREYFLNYHFAESFRLKFGENELIPKLVTVDPDNGVSNDLKLTMVFVPENETVKQQLVKSDLTLSFIDPIYGTGITKYKFKNKDIQSVPELKM